MNSKFTIKVIKIKYLETRTKNYQYRVKYYELCIKVYLTPDRTAEQRAEHRKLVEQLKKKGKDEPARQHDIKGGHICSTELKNRDNVSM